MYYVYEGAEADKCWCLALLADGTRKSLDRVAREAQAGSPWFAEACQRIDKIECDKRNKVEVQFYGYKTREDMQKYWDEKILREKGRVTIKTIWVASPNKVCVGSFDGYEFIYEDGSRDRGVEMADVKVDYKNYRIAWAEELSR